MQQLAGNYKAMLEAKMAELLASSFRKNHLEAIRIEKSADDLDDTQLAGARDLAIRNMDHNADLLRLVRAALARIEDGSYGICLHCEEEIKSKRLDALPWAAFCIRCQEAVDRGELGTVSDLDELFSSAA